MWYILSNSTIEYATYCFQEQCYTLDEFKARFFYKVGDKVISKYGKLGCISSLIWSEKDNQVRYELDADADSLYFANDLQPYKAKTMEEQNKKSVNHVYESEVISFSIAQKDKYELDLQGKFEVKLRDGKYFVERIKPQYPKTYEECCKVLSLGEDGRLYTKGYKASLIQNFQKLLICRDAYWTIAGEQMGLGEPWKPDWLNVEQDKFVLYTHDNVICSNRFVLGHNVLAFPTKEMRDAFYENFKDLIEDCKELL